MSNDLIVKGDDGLLHYISHLWPDFTLLLVPHEAGLDVIPPLFVGILLLFTALTLLLFTRSCIKVILCTNYMKKQLAGLKGVDAAVTRRQLQKEFSREQKRFGGICQAWQDFDQTLVASTDGSRIYSTIPSDQFFNSHRIAPKVTESRFWAAVPSILLSIGVLGTFVGLTFGLMGIEIGADADVSALRDGIGSMIEGASIAFITSIWGVFLSVLVNIYFKIGEGRIRYRVHDLQNHIDQLFPGITAEGTLSEIADDSKESRMALQTLHEKIGEKLQEQLYTVGNRLQESLVQGVQDVMRESLDKLNTQVSQQATDTLDRLVQQFMERMGETGAEQRRMLDEASDTMQSTVRKLNDQMSSMMDRLSEQQEQADQREHERQKALTGGIEQIGQAQAQTEASLSRLSQQQNEHSEKLERASEQLLSELRGATDALERSSAQLNSSAGSLEGVSSNLQQASNTLGGPVRDMTDRLASLAQEMERIEKNVGLHIQLLDEMQQKVSKASEALGNSAELANNGFKELENHQKQFLADLKQTLGNAHQELRSQAEDFAKQMEKWLEQYANQVSSQTQDRMQEWDEQTRNFADNLSRTVTAISQVVDELEGQVNQYAAR